MKNLIIISFLLLAGGYGFGQETNTVKPTKTLTIYYYGMPRYPDSMLNKVGVKYGVRWQNLGCVVDTIYDKHNDMINSILNKRNGEGWKAKFWEEVKENNKK